MIEQFHKASALIAIQEKLSNASTVCKRIQDWTKDGILRGIMNASTMNKISLQNLAKPRNYKKIRKE